MNTNDKYSSGGITTITNWNYNRTVITSSYHQLTPYLKRRHFVSRVQGNHHSETAYTHGNTIMTENVRNDTNAWTTDYVGVRNITTHTACGALPYLYGFGLDAAPYVAYPVGQYNSLLTKALNKLADITYSPGEDLLEARETLSYVAKRTVDILSICNDIVRLRFNSVAHKLGWRKAKRRRVKRKLTKLGSDSVAKINNLWLESRYAIRPLLISTEDAIKTYGKGLEAVNQPMIKVKAGINEPLTRTNTYYDHSDIANGVAKHRITLQLQINDLDTLARVQLGVDTSSLIWAGIPFSFMVDWGLGVASFLKAQQIYSAVTFVDGSQSAKISGEVLRKWDYRPTGGKVTGHERYFAVVYQRWPLAYITTPFPRIKNPFGTFEGVKRSMDIFAILFNQSRVPRNG